MSQDNPFRVAEPVDDAAGSAPDEGQRAVAAALAWYQKRPKQIFRLFGPAGTGKTTLAKTIAAKIGGPVCFAAFSGKAASVMRAKGCADATTIHSLIYVPHLTEGKLTFILNEQSRLLSAPLLILDEASMVDTKLGRELALL